METFQFNCEIKGNKADCYGTTTSISDNSGTSSLIFRNEITPDNLLIAGLMIFIGVFVFANFFVDVFFIKKVKLKQ